MTYDTENKNAYDIFNSIFLFHKQLPKLLDWETGKRRHSQQYMSCMIFGSHHTMKTSLLFQAAVNHCNDGEKTLFITQTLLHEIPPLIDGMCRPNHTNMSYLEIIYIDEFSNLVHYLATFHVNHLQIIPLMIVLDNLDYYIEQIKDESDVEQQCAKLCALLQDSIYFCSKKRGSTAALQVSCKKSHTCVKLFHIFSHFFQNIWSGYAFKEDFYAGKMFVTLTQISGNGSETENLTLFKGDNLLYFANEEFVNEKF